MTEKDRRTNNGGKGAGGALPEKGLDTGMALQNNKLYLSVWVSPSY